MGIGLMISKMGLVLKLGLMEQSMKETTKKGKSMEKGNSILLMEVCTMETFKIMKSLVKVNIGGMMVRYMKESGLKTKCMVKAD